MSIVFLIWLFKKSIVKYNKIKNPGFEDAAWDQTYCIWTLYLVRIAQITIIQQILLLLNASVGFGLGNSFKKYYFTEDDKTCTSTTLDKRYRPMSLVNIVFQFFMILLSYAQLNLQKFEWLSMSYIITSEKDRTVEQITFDHLWSWSRKHVWKCR